MRKNERQIDESELLPFHIIQAASEGDVEAINVVLKHYEGYITSLSTRMLFDEYGQAYFCVDETLRRRLETKLITKILDFEPVPSKRFIECESKTSIFESTVKGGKFFTEKNF